MKLHEKCLLDGHNSSSAEFNTSFKVYLMRQNGRNKIEFCRHAPVIYQLCLHFVDTLFAGQYKTSRRNFPGLFKAILFYFPCWPKPVCSIGSARPCNLTVRDVGGEDNLQYPTCSKLCLVLPEIVQNNIGVVSKYLSRR